MESIGQVDKGNRSQPLERKAMESAPNRSPELAKRMISPLVACFMFWLLILSCGGGPGL